MAETLYKMAVVWFIGFFPLFEIYIAVPSGLALGLDPISVIIFSVAGNFTPILLIEYGYTRLMKYQKVRQWIVRPIPIKLEQNLKKYGFWYVLIVTPWTGVWLMAIAAKLLQINRRLLLWGSFVSILIYAIVIVLLIQLGVDIFTDTGVEQTGLST